MAKAHFAPTDRSMENLLSEGVAESDVFVTGNTVVDAVRYTRCGGATRLFDGEKRNVLLTVHRREAGESELECIFSAVRRIAEEFSDVRFIYPVHPRQAVREVAERVLSGCEGVVLTEPFDVSDFHRCLEGCYFAVTDSGGVQEEAVAMGKPVLVVRNTTERGEGILSGNIRLVGTSFGSVYRGIRELLVNRALHYAMSKKGSTYGNGRASEAIAAVIEDSICS